MSEYTETRHARVRVLTLKDNLHSRLCPISTQLRSDHSRIKVGTGQSLTLLRLRPAYSYSQLFLVCFPRTSVSRLFRLSREKLAPRRNMDWFPATIVAHWPTNSEHDRLLMHFDDGMDERDHHAARRHRAPDRRGCCCAVQVCPVCCPARGRGWRLYAAASAASAAAAAELAQGRPKPGLNLVCVIGSPTQADPCLDPVYRKQD